MRKAASGISSFQKPGVLREKNDSSHVNGPRDHRTSLDVCTSVCSFQIS